MRLARMILLYISCTIVNAQRNIDQLLRRQLQPTYDDDYESRLGEPLISRYAEMLVEFDFEIQELIRKDMFQVLREMHTKKEKEKPASGGGDSNSEGGSGGDAPKEEDSESDDSSETSSQEADDESAIDDGNDGDNSE